MRAALLLLAALALAGCGSTARKPSPYYKDDGPPETVPADLDKVPDATPKNEAFHKFANRPYTVFGQTYVPVVNQEPYKQRGLASWYGRKFHGQRTASGETYDMFAMTAAHKTLPIPSYARVTNLANGKSVVVRINDRGPFHSSRIIDLSYGAAQRIGLAARGSGMVEVERVFETSEAPAATTSSAAPAPTTPEAVAVAAPADAAKGAAMWLQLGAFSSAESAAAFRERAARELAWIHEPLEVVQRDGLYRVRLGPYASREEADAIADKVGRSLGYPPILQR